MLDLSISALIFACSFFHFSSFLALVSGLSYLLSSLFFSKLNSCSSWFNSFIKFSLSVSLIVSSAFIASISFFNPCDVFSIFINSSFSFVVIISMFSTFSAIMVSFFSCIFNHWASNLLLADSEILGSIILSPYSFCLTLRSTICSW